MKSFRANENTTLKLFTDNTYPQGSFYFNQLLKKKDIKVNGVKVGKDIPVKSGDEVSYYTTLQQESKSAFSIVYEDDNVLIVDKESGVNAEAVFATLSIDREVYFIHRLDRNTQGLMAFALNTTAEQELLQQFKNSSVEKIYLALCVGKLPKKKDIAVAYLTKNSENSLVYISATPKKGAEKIITEYEVLEENNDLSLVQIVLHSGKTHQIRAHLSFLGAPVLGDGKYGNKLKNQQYNRTRQCLIAKKLTFFNTNLPNINGKTFISQFTLHLTFGE